MENNLERVSFDLPLDIIFDILTRLPVKTLVRFKYVCKTWYTLIENPNFVSTQQKIQSNQELDFTFSNMLVITNGVGNTKNCRLLHFSESSHKPTHLDLPYLSNTESCVVVGICNGLVCVSLSLDSRKIIICNPTTRQFRNIPSFKLPKEEHSLIFLGFGLQDNGYKLIRIVFTPRWVNNIHVIRAELYTMSTDTWREIEVKLGDSGFLEKLHSHRKDYPEAVLINGVFYWKAQCDNGVPFVVYFDICKKVFDVIEAPWILFYSPVNFCHLQEFRKKLAVIIQHDKWFDWCELKEDMTWSFIYREFFRIPTKFGGKFRVVGFTKNDEFILVNLYEDKLELLWVDLYLVKNSQPCRKVNVEGTIDDAYLYTEALTLVN